MADDPVPEVYRRVGDLGLLLGVKDIKDLPGCWELNIDELWFVACNGHPEPMECSRNPTKLNPYEMYFEFNGWPFGIVDGRGGSLGHGAAANEDTLLAAINAAIEKEESDAPRGA